jgi:hypothetical protein
MSLLIYQASAILYELITLNKWRMKVDGINREEEMSCSKVAGLPIEEMRSMQHRTGDSRATPSERDLLGKGATEMS